MEPEALIDQLVAAGDARTHPPADEAAVRKFEESFGFRLPEAHRRMLSQTNGFEAFRGYFRLFGVGRGAAIEMESWNAAQLWKFAYRGAADRHLCFAELGSGHQFGYRLDEASDAGTSVDHLLVNNMRAVFRYPRFEAFLDTPFLHGVLYRDGDFVEWMRRLGELAPDEHVAHRSFGVLDESRRELFEKMGAVDSMVFYGDAWFEHQPDGAAAERLEFYVDDVGRRRLRVVWEESSRS
jgi:hypothetical protein